MLSDHLDTGAWCWENTGTIFPNVMKPSRDVGPFLEITKELAWTHLKLLCLALLFLKIIGIAAL